MQKLLSSAIYTICLILLSLSYINATKDFLSGFAPFSQYEETSPPESQKITAKSLGITSSASEPSRMYSKAYCLIDADSNRILASKDADIQLPMASTTKIMTCIVALENGNPDDIVTVSKYASSMPDVQLNIFFFKQKTAYDIRASDWSSDVCSSDLKACSNAEQWVKSYIVKVKLALVPFI